MTILFIDNTLSNGGMENFIVDMANTLIAEHSIFVISFADLENSWLPPKRLNKNVEIITLGTLDVLSPILWIKLFKQIKRIKPDIIHLNSSPSLVPFFIFSLIFPNVVYTFHSPPLVETDTGVNYKTKIFRYIIKYLFKFNLIKTVCISSESYYQYINLFGFKPNKLIYNGIVEKILSNNHLDVKKYYDEIRENGFKKVFLAVGRFDIIKNFEMLVKVFRKYDNSNVKIALVLVLSTLDEGSKAQDFKNTAPNNVFIIGAKDNIIDYMYYADALCISSIAEGFSLVMAESISVGLPILSTPVGGPLEFIKEGKNGFLSVNFDEKSFQEIIDKFMSLSQDEILQIKQNNIELYKQHLTMERCAKEYLEFYKSILNQ